MWITLKIFDISACVLNLFFIKKYLHIYQLKDYNNARYVSFFSKRKFVPKNIRKEKHNSKKKSIFR